MSNKKTSHTEAELIEIFKQDNIDEQHFQKFIAYYKVCFDELYEDHKDWDDEDWDEGDSVQASALWCTNRFVKPYLELLENGHGEEWAYELAHTSEDGERAVYFTYSEIEEIDPELAKKELQIYAKSLDGDEYFQRHYIYLFEVYANPEGRIETAKNYSKIYKAEIAKGKSDVYAHEYAYLMADGEYHEIYCEEYAFAFENAKKENKSNQYARVYAEKYASALVDIKMRYGISDDEEMIDFAIDKVTAYMKAWECNILLKVKDFERFAEIYENKYFNAYFSDDDMPIENRGETDKLILEKTLEMYNKLHP